jgi:hypothetical protein
MLGELINDERICKEVTVAIPALISRDIAKTLIYSLRTVGVLRR